MNKNMKLMIIGLMTFVSQVSMANPELYLCRFDPVNSIHLAAGVYALQVDGDTVKYVTTKPQRISGIPTTVVNSTLETLTQLTSSESRRVYVGSGQAAKSIDTAVITSGGIVFIQYGENTRLCTKQTPAAHL